MMSHQILSLKKDCFADDCVCFHEIKDEEDTVTLQMDIDRLGCWAGKYEISTCQMQHDAAD